MKHDIFISYRRSDRELVAQVVRKLEANGVGVWYDAEIDSGADWRESIVEALTAADMLVIFFSEECNSSRQLKKELAIADSLEKPVIPILIEDTKPKGAYLYELADRNWLQAFPDPHSKIDTIVSHLTALAEKSDGGLDGAAPGAALGSAIATPPPPQPAPAPVARAATEAPSTAVAPAEAAAAEAPLVEAPLVRDEHDTAPGWRQPAPAPAPPPQRKTAAKPGPKLSDYLPKLTAKQKKAAEARDILPFRWMDCLYFLPFLLVFSWWLIDGAIIDLEYSTTEDQIGVLLLFVALIAFYGAIVFPIRYYLRRRPPVQAFRSYVISSAILYGVFVGTFLLARAMGEFLNDDPAEIIVMFGLIWIGFAIIAFVIYGAMSAQRAIRSFRSNMVKI